jgi:hypothetical protein
MATYSIPAAVVNGFTQIAMLSEEALQEIEAALKDVPLRIRQHHVFDDSEFKVSGISEREAKGIKEALLPLYSALAGGTVSVETYIDDITESLKEEERDELDWINSEDVVSRFKQRLLRLLSISSLQLVAKAHDVLLEHEQTFSSARILSDIRPVFAENVEDPPSAAVIVHMLNISYRKAHQRREFVLALDVKDISYLIELLERAKAKTENLKSVIASSSMTYLDVV